MTLFSIVAKSMKQRRLACVLTVVSVALSVGLAVGILVVHREVEKGFYNPKVGWDVIVGPGNVSELELVLSAVLNVQSTTAKMPYSLYEELCKDERIDFAAPFCTGDSFQGFRVVATEAVFFEKWEYDPGYLSFTHEGVETYVPGEKLKLAEGRWFGDAPGEAVVGAFAAQKTRLKKQGVEFTMSHGLSVDEEIAANVEHGEHPFKVVGILEPTGSSVDKVIYVSLASWFSLAGHAEGAKEAAALRRERDGGEGEDHGDGHGKSEDGDHGDEHEHDEQNEQAEEETHDVERGEGHEHSGEGSQGDEHDHEEGEAHEEEHAKGHEESYNDHDEHAHGVPSKDLWELTSIGVRFKGTSPTAPQEFVWELRNTSKTAQAVFPLQRLRMFFQSTLSHVLYSYMAIAAMVVAITAVGIMVWIYNSMNERRRDIAIMRSLGASRSMIVRTILLESAALLAMGAIVGLPLGHAGVLLAADFIQARSGAIFDAWTVSRIEVLVVVGTTLLGIVVGIVPAVKAYNTDVVENLKPLA